MENYLNLEASEEKVVSLRSKKTDVELSSAVSFQEYKKQLIELTSPTVVEELMQTKISQ